MTSIVYKTKNFAVILKPAGIPSQSDNIGDADAMKLTTNLLRECGEKDEIYLVHRLDRVVGGLMVFARNKKYAGILSTLVSKHDFTKEYLAVVEGDLSRGTFVDYIYKDSSLGKAFVAKKERAGVKKAELDYKALDHANINGRPISLVKIRLKTGRFHQIRVQFASRGYSLLGDKKYGNKDFGTRFPALFATRLAFEAEENVVDVSMLPDIENYPWSLFAKEKYEDKGEI